MCGGRNPESDPEPDPNPNQVAKPEGEAELVRLPLVQYDEDEAQDTSRRFNHTYTF